MLAIRDIRKSFGGIAAVNGCSFDVAEGSIRGLIGPNGAGKSTLFNIVTGFIRPDSGTVTLRGEDVTGLPPYRLFERGLVRTFQIPHEFSRLTVLENLMVVPAGQRGEGVFSSLFRWGAVKQEERQIRRRADEVLEFLKLTHVRMEVAGNLSGGQKKLVELGRAMMSGAKLVLLDEPGAGVNRTLLAELTERIADLNRDHGYTFCIIEHDMDVIAKLCHPIVVMAEGAVLTQGTMADIRANKAVQEAYLGGSVTAATDQG